MIYLQINLDITPENRAAAAAVYQRYKPEFLNRVPGAKSKELLVREEDVQVLHGFESKAQAEAYLKSDMFNNDVVTGLSPLLNANPEIRIYAAN